MKKAFKFLGLLSLTITITIAGYLTYVSTQISIVDLGVQETPEKLYIGIKEENVAMKDYPAAMEEAFTKLENVIKKNPSIDFGKPFSIYKKSTTGENYDLVMGYEINDGDVITENYDFIIKDTRPSIHARVFSMKGEYNYLMYAWFYAILKAGTIDENQISYELYEVSYNDNVPENQFITNIYIPIFGPPDTP